MINDSFAKQVTNAKIDASRSMNTAAQFNAISSFASTGLDMYNVNSSSNTISSPSRQ